MKKSKNILRRRVLNNDSARFRNRSVETISTNDFINLSNDSRRQMVADLDSGSSDGIAIRQEHEMVAGDWKLAVGVGDLDKLSVALFSMEKANLCVVVKYITYFLKITFNQN